MQQTDMALADGLTGNAVLLLVVDHQVQATQVVALVNRQGLTLCQEVRTGVDDRQIEYARRHANCLDQQCLTRF